MVYSEELADRVRAALSARVEFTERKMFGGIAFMVNTHMACGISRDELMVRVGKEGFGAALADGAQEMRMGDRTMRGMVTVDAAQTSGPDELDRWVARGVDLALAEPPKPGR